MKQKYDIFVSYRRTSFESAQMIATSLRAKGYSVFFDVESLRGGKFNEQLFDVIYQCKDFLLILPENALDRCNDPEDWVRREVLYAMQCKKNIIPVMLYGFYWPKQMPKGMEDLPLYQSVTASSREYFDIIIEKLCKNYLKSSRRHVKFFKITSMVLFSLIILAAIIFSVLRMLSGPVAVKIGTDMVTHLKELDLIAAEYATLNDKWNKFTNDVASNDGIESYDDIYKLTSQMIFDLESTELYLDDNAPKDTVQRQIGFWDALLLSSRGLTTSDLEVEPLLQSNIIYMMRDDVARMKSQFSDSCYSSLNLQLISIHHEIFNSFCKCYLYSHAELLRLMPSETQEAYGRASATFAVLPNDIPLTLSRDEYVRKEDVEQNRIIQLRDNIEALIEKGETLTEETVAKESTINYLFSKIWELSRQKKYSEELIATKRQIVETKRAENDVTRKQIEEENARLEELYNALVEKCTLKEEDSQWLMWGKIIKFARGMETDIASHASLQKKGVKSASSINPQVFYANLASMVNSFKAYHPEHSDVAETIKVFYKEVSKSQRPLAGVVVYEISGSHPVHKPGDILISMKGTDVATREELKNAYKKEGLPSVVFLRLENGELTEHHVDDCKRVDNIRYMDLKD